MKPVYKQQPAGRQPALWTGPVPGGTPQLPSSMACTMQVKSQIVQNLPVEAAVPVRPVRAEGTAAGQDRDPSLSLSPIVTCSPETLCSTSQLVPNSCQADDSVNAK